MAETQQVLFVRILLGIPFSLEIRMFLFSGSREETGEGNGTHSSPLAWKIPWTEEPGGLQSMGSRRVGHDWATSLPLFAFMHWRRKRQPIQCSCLENPRDGGAWWAALYGVAQSRTRLKRLSSSSREETSHRRLLCPVSGRKGRRKVQVTFLLLPFFQTSSTENVDYPRWWWISSALHFLMKAPVSHKTYIKQTYMPFSCGCQYNFQTHPGTPRGWRKIFPSSIPP